MRTSFTGANRERCPYNRDKTCDCHDPVQAAAALLADFPRYLRGAKADRGVTLRALADQSGVSQPTVTKALRGGNLRVDTVQLLLAWMMEEE